MDQGTEPIRQDIDQIRASMTDKMERIEARIKGTVDETTHSVKRMVDVKHQISEHPWTALGISILAGIALGSMGESDSSHAEHRRTDDRTFDLNAAAAYERARSTSPYPANYGATGYGQYSAASYGQPGYEHASHGHSSTPAGGYSASSGTYQPAAAGSSSPPGPGHTTTSSNGPWSQTVAAAGGTWNASANQPPKPGIMDQISQQFGGEIEMLKSTAVSSLVGIIRDTIRQNFPAMHQEMERMRREHGASGAGSWTDAGSATSYGARSGHPEDTFRSNPSR